MRSPIPEEMEKEWARQTAKIMIRKDNRARWRRAKRRIRHLLRADRNRILNPKN